MMGSEKPPLAAPARAHLRDGLGEHVRRCAERVANESKLVGEPSVKVFRLARLNGLDRSKFGIPVAAAAAKPDGCVW